AVRVNHHEVKEAFELHDYLVVGVVREAEGGVFRPETLERVATLTEEIKDIPGVLADDILAPTEVDDVFTTPEGILRVDTLMEEAPEDLAGGQRILARIRENPILKGKLASDDGQAMAIFVPLEAKDLAHEVGSKIEVLIDDLGGDEEWHLAGIPIAEDRFGSEMFLQMAVAAPAAFLLIFLLMLFFFRNFRLVLAPMIVAMMSVTWAIGLLIGMGYTVHIMSSMIPIFLIPIAVLNSIHMLSEFHERWPKTRDRRRALRETLDELYTPMIFTSITTVVGFISLVMTPIPPVQVFGAFVAFGIAAAWFLTITFLVSYAVLVPESALENFGHVKEHDFVGGHWIRGLKNFALHRAPIAVGILVLMFSVSVWGLTKIEVNDNPVRWFRSNHPIRQADTAMNAHLAGTYLVFLSLKGEDANAFDSPEALSLVQGLQRKLEQDPQVGATTSIVDVVKKVRSEFLSDPAAAILPDSQEEIAQFLFLYEISGGDTSDLFKMITPDHDRANLWIQMRKGENRDVARVVATANDYLRDANSPFEAKWAGLPYINIVWQSKMVRGTGNALAGSFVVVLLMMAGLFRSFRLGLLSMVPLTATIAAAYGFIGWIGKPYDMPIAVLSSLSLGLSIDFAIHFLQRAREAYDRHGNLEAAMDEVFETPARAILRNVFVIALGFVPMFFANLLPYVTVASFFFAIMLVSGASTLLFIPAILALGKGKYLASARRPVAPAKVAAATALFLGVMIGAANVSPAEAAPNADEIMKASHLNMYYAADDGRAEVQMELVDKKGRTRNRSFVMIRRDVEEGGKQKYFTYFLEPSDVRRTTFMVWKDPQAEDSRWIYVPALDLVRQISSKDKGSSFVGSDFSYEDVSGRHWTDDTHEFVRDEELDGRPAHVIKSTPVEDEGGAYRITWVDSERLLPLKEEWYDKKGEIDRVFRAEKVEDIEGYPTVTVRVMETPRSGSHTTVTFTDVSYDVGAGDDLFTERHLKNPPRDLVTGGAQ
ncbi:MAG: outer membrane lipoprotein-sorting protein, partial [Gemmatimonadetes bacterium]|nr:outer membrane lipoprotein-sorting protein [Gemmatimonadota bacterium]